MYNISDASTIEIVIVIINMLMVLAIIFLERKSPTSTLAWTLLLAFIPIVGFIFYLVFNQNLSRLKINRYKNKEDDLVNVLLDQIETIDNGKYNLNNKVAYKWKHLIKINQLLGNSFYTDNNQITVITDGKEFMSSILDDIEAATKSIYIETFIIKPDEVGLYLIDALTKKAKEGLDVRLLMDAMGSIQIKKHHLRGLIKAGGKCGFFFKPKLFALKINYRNHRKIALIDDKVSYCGGYNFAREYVGLKEKFGYWRDTHFRIVGDSVNFLKIRFLMDWRFTTKNNTENISLSNEDKLIVGSTLSETYNKSGVQIVSCGPTSDKEEVKHGFLRMIGYAENKISIQTPYFVPDQSLLDSLKVAAASGVEVRIMVPCKPDHIFVYWANMAYLGEMLEAGAKVYIYENGFIHSKTLTVDGEVTTCGSTNFDIRSFNLNFETNAFIYDGYIASQMEKIFDNDIKMCHELTLEEYSVRPYGQRIKESISRLFSNIL